MNKYATMKSIVEQARKAAQALTGNRKWAAIALAVLAAAVFLLLNGCPERGLPEERLLHALYHCLTDTPCTLPDK